MSATLTAESPFELLELPDGRWCVARPVLHAEQALVAGSFANLDRPSQDTAAQPGPVGVYASRDEAERAIQRTEPARDPLAPFAVWLREGNAIPSPRKRGEG